MIIKMESPISLEELLLRIEYADHHEIDEIINALQRRYRRLFPDWDVMFLSVHSGNKKECAQQVELLIQSLKKQYLE